MYLTTLSGALVALGLIGGIDGFGDAFYVFALVILPAELFIGFATFIRMGADELPRRDDDLRDEPDPRRVPRRSPRTSSRTS